MERINLVELLKDCIGMELDCVIFDDVTLYRIDTSLENEYPIRIETKSGNFLDLTKYGTYSNIEESKCVIFPKGKTTWEGFVPSCKPCKFKDGDVIVDKYGSVSIYKQVYDSHEEFLVDFHCGLTSINRRLFIKDKDSLQHCGEISSIRLATEEEKAELFQAIEDNGYKWNEETKTLEKLVEPKFKDGDILYCNANDDGEDKDMFKYIFIFDKIVDVDGTQFYYSHCHLFGSEFYDTKANLVHDYSVRFATEEEKEKLFNAIKENGYRWNSETKTLGKLPKFKVGDRIRHKTDIWPSNRTIKSYDKNIGYFTTINDWVRIEDQDNWELVPNKFDVNTLKPLQPVLVRNTNGQVWSMDFFSHKIDTDKRLQISFVCVGHHCPNQCIPYEGNEHLRGKTDDCDEFYKTWIDN